MSLRVVPDGRAGAGVTVAVPLATAEAVFAAGTAMTSRIQSPVRRHRRVELRDYGDEFLGMDSGMRPQYDESVASDQGAGMFGFSGTASTDTVLPATGFPALAFDGFSEGTPVPMLSGTGEQRPGRPGMGGR